MTESNLAVEKKKLRGRMLHQRDALTPAEIQRKSLRVVGNVLTLPEFQTAKIVACYVNKGSEVETKPIIRNYSGYRVGFSGLPGGLGEGLL
ncbi:hypothetical protein E6H36_03290 [Candidatus Bathyarchaeota archaeon]|nr:MAG: hypothetical protein E6H36_03290 [Candidatus Bathyarchaeota archaeon]